MRRKKGSKVSAEDENFSPKLSYPYPNEFAQPNFPTEFARPSYPTEFAKPCYPTEFDKPHFPTNFTKPSQIQTPTQNDLTDSTILSRWDNVIQQLLIQSIGDKGQNAPAWEPEPEVKIERPHASYCPPLPSPHGPLPPPAFTYDSPANSTETESQTEFENAHSPPPRYFRWNTNSQWMIQADKDK